MVVHLKLFLNVFSLSVSRTLYSYIIGLYRNWRKGAHNAGAILDQGTPTPACTASMQEDALLTHKALIYLGDVPKVATIST